MSPSSPRSDDRRSLYDVLRFWAEDRPDAEAAVDPGRRLTYAGLKAAVDRCAAALVGAGVMPGDRVACLCPPSTDFLVTFLAASAVGAIWTGLNPRYADPELDALVDRIEPALVFVAPAIDDRGYGDWAARAAAAGRRVVTLDGAQDAFLAGAVAPEAVRARIAAVSLDAPCLMVFTSGSTGQPKGALISAAALVGASEVQRRAWPAEPLRILNNLPINHIGCVGDIGCYALVAGGCLVFRPRFDAAGTPAVIRDEGITVWAQVPTMFQNVLDHSAFDPAMLAGLQLIVWGGAHASSELIARLRPLAPRLATSYGQTETVGSIVFTAPDADLRTLAETVGRVVPPYEARLSDEGEIEVRTPFGMLGYFRDEAATRRVIGADGWRRTGDVGLLSLDGDLRLLGRVHDVFKSGGYNIYPPEIEAALAAHPAVREAAVVGAPDPLYGEAVVAFVSGEDLPDEGALRDWCRARLANYKVPKRIVALDALPRLAVGKIDKPALLARWGDA